MRRVGKAAAAAGAIVLMCAAMRASNAAMGTWEVANAFAAEYKAWAHMRNARQAEASKAGTVSYVEFAAWQRVKSAFRALQTRTDNEYRGNR